MPRLHKAALNCSMDKLKLRLQNLCQVFNFRLGHDCICQDSVCITKQPNLKLKLWPKLILGYLLFAFGLTIVPRCIFDRVIGTIGGAQKLMGNNLKVVLAKVSTLS